MTYETRYQQLFDTAAAIAQRGRLSNPLPPLFFFTDHKRTPDPEAIAVHLPAGTGVIYRHFGEAERTQRAHALRRIADERQLVLLIGADVALALEVGAHGVHLPERDLDRAEALKHEHRDLIVTSACHGAATLAHPAIRSGTIDAVFVSPVFASQSLSARGVFPLGIEGVRALAERSVVPVYGLGGMSLATMARVQDCGLAGIAAIDAFVQENEV